jgi:hypothetical protein
LYEEGFDVAIVNVFLIGSGCVVVLAGCYVLVNALLFATNKSATERRFGTMIQASFNKLIDAKLSWAFNKWKTGSNHRRLSC